MKKVMVAMSGGVDSSAALVILKKEYDVVGATLQLHDGQYEQDGVKTCCSLSDIDDAKQVAARLSVPHYVFNMKELFHEKVIGRFISWYEAGLTPNPCIDCNKYIKFDALLTRALSLECDMIATGHYARNEYDEESGRWLLKKAAGGENGGNDKDQSYVLCDLTQEQLSHILFPLGGMTKDQVRAVAEDYSLVNAHKAESQDICFVPDGDYAGFIRRETGKEYPFGDVTDRQGNILGTHCGLINYTIGQRKGLGIALGTPAYVISKDMEKNALILGSKDDLLTTALTADRLNWIAFDKPEKAFSCKAKTRYRMKEQPCTVYPLADGKVRVEFDAPVRAVAPGQRAVFYDGDTVLGGGVIV